MENDNQAGADDEFARRLAASSPPVGKPAPVDDVAPEAPAQQLAQPPHSLAADLNGPAAPVYRAPEFFGADELAAAPLPAADPPPATGPAVARSSYLPPAVAHDTPPVARHAAPDAATPPVASPTPEYPVVNPYLAPPPAPDLYSSPVAAPAAAAAAPEPAAAPAVPVPAEQAQVAPTVPSWSAPQYAPQQPSSQIPEVAVTPAPDPEPIPSSAPQFTAPVYAAPAPAPSEPTYAEPVYAEPAYSEPTYSAPPPAAPTFSAPAAPAPTHPEPSPPVSAPDPEPAGSLFVEPAAFDPSPVVAAAPEPPATEYAIAEPTFEQSFAQTEYVPPRPPEPVQPESLPVPAAEPITTVPSEPSVAQVPYPVPHPETAPLDRLSALFEPTGPAPIVAQADPQPVAAQPEPREQRQPEPREQRQPEPLVEPVAAVIPLVEPVAPTVPVAERRPTAHASVEVPPSESRLAEPVARDELTYPAQDAPLDESPVASAPPSIAAAPPPTVPAFRAPAEAAPTAVFSAPPPAEIRQDPATPRPDPAGTRLPVIAAGSPAVLGLLSPDSPAVPDQRELAKSTVFEKASLAAAVVLPVVGLGVAVAAAARSARRRGWVIGLVRASVVIGIASTVAGGIGGAIGYNALLDQRQHDTVAAASAQFCATVAASPEMLELPTFGWPAPAGTIAETLAAMRAYQDKWTALAAVSPSGIAADATQVATAAGTIISSVELSRTVSDANNIASMTSVAGNSGVPAWAAEYCG